VFGHAKGRSGYSFADVHEDKVLYRIKELYPIVYGKSIVQKFKVLGKELQKGIVAKWWRKYQLVGSILAMTLRQINRGNGNKVGYIHCKEGINIGHGCCGS
jgi:hypothetical protein